MAQTNRPDAGRPDPDALLGAFRRETAGRLKVFLGAAPGVGKTYAMLQNARRLKEEGVDVVIGFVETHGRAETSALVQGLEVLARRRIEYRGRTLEEFDLDAALKRKPKLIVVDELAHTNAPDSRHPKRWQDVQELLDAGVNVWTALNIQHLESLADVVSRITGVAIRETVPDRVLQEAADVVLVDLTPDELIQRLNDGKVYVPEAARRATQNFFTPGNLTALRELALRRTAERVDDQMVDYLRQKAIEGPWASERLLACVGPDGVSERVIRRASQLATGLNADWTAVTVETIGEAADAKRANRLAKVFSLAERLGAQTMRLQGSDYPTEILRTRRPRKLHSDRARPVAGWSCASPSRAVAAGCADAARRRNRDSHRSGPREAEVIVAGSQAASGPPGAWNRNRRRARFRRGCRRGRRGSLRGPHPSQPVDDLPHRGSVLRGALWNPRRRDRLARVVRRI